MLAAATYQHPTSLTHPLPLHHSGYVNQKPLPSWRWDEPELDEIILSGIESSRRRAEEG